VSTKLEALERLNFVVLDISRLRQIADAAEAAGGLLPGHAAPAKRDGRRGRRNIVHQTG
jgi:hypothetical protein